MLIYIQSFFYNEPNKLLAKFLYLYAKYTYFYQHIEKNILEIRIEDKANELMPVRSCIRAA